MADKTTEQVKLRRIRAGEYQTQDSAFTILKDPQSGDEPGGWGFISWLTYQESLGSDAGALSASPSLRAARAELADLLNRRQLPLDPVTREPQEAERG